MKDGERRNRGKEMVREGRIGKGRVGRRIHVVGGERVGGERVGEEEKRSESAGSAIKQIYS